MEFWASREDSFYDTEPEEYRFDHLDPLPDDSPLLTEWTSYDDGPDIPPVPLSYPTLRTDIVHATDADTDARGFDQIEVGTVVAIEILDHIDEWPQEPDIDKREIDIDLSPPSRYPRIQYDDINPLPPMRKFLGLFTLSTATQSGSRRRRTLHTKSMRERKPVCIRCERRRFTKRRLSQSTDL